MTAARKATDRRRGSEPKYRPPASARRTFLATALAALTVADDPDAWERVGFAVRAQTCTVGSICIHLAGADGPRGIRSWSLRDAPTSLTDLDGLPTTTATDAPPEPSPAHPNRVVSVDHLVVGSPDRQRTITRMRELLGLEPRRQTEHELYGRRMVQTFYRLGEAVLEVISRPDDRGDGPSVFWGLAFTVDDLDLTADLLGEHVSAPKAAVQPGRRIATLWGEAIGISVPVAFLSQADG